MKFFSKKIIVALALITGCATKKHSMLSSSQVGKDIVSDIRQEDKYLNVINQFNFGLHPLNNYKLFKGKLLKLVSDPNFDQNTYLKRMGGSIPLIFGVINALLHKAPSEYDYEFLKYCVQKLNISLKDIRSENNVLHMMCWQIKKKTSENKNTNDILTIFESLIRAAKECNKFNELVKLSYTKNKQIKLKNKIILGDKNPIHKVFSIFNHSRLQFKIAYILIFNIRNQDIEYNELIYLFKLSTKRASLFKETNHSYFKYLLDFLNNFSLQKDFKNSEMLIIYTIMKNYASLFSEKVNYVLPIYKQFFDGYLKALKSFIGENNCENIVLRIENNNDINILNDISNDKNKDNDKVNCLIILNDDNVFDSKKRKNDDDLNDIPKRKKQKINSCQLEHSNNNQLFQNDLNISNRNYNTTNILLDQKEDPGNYIYLDYNNNNSLSQNDLNSINRDYSTFNSQSKEKKVFGYNEYLTYNNNNSLSQNDLDISNKNYNPINITSNNKENYDYLNYSNKNNSSNQNNLYMSNENYNMIDASIYNSLEFNNNHYSRVDNINNNNLTPQNQYYPINNNSNLINVSNSNIQDINNSKYLALNNSNSNNNNLVLQNTPCITNTNYNNNLTIQANQYIPNRNYIDTSNTQTNNFVPSFQDTTHFNNTGNYKNNFNANITVPNGNNACLENTQLVIQNNMENKPIILSPTQNIVLLNHLSDYIVRPVYSSQFQRSFYANQINNNPSIILPQNQNNIYSTTPNFHSYQPYQNNIILNNANKNSVSNVLSSNNSSILMSPSPVVIVYSHINNNGYMLNP